VPPVLRLLRSVRLPPLPLIARPGTPFIRESSFIPANTPLSFLRRKSSSTTDTQGSLESFLSFVTFSPKSSPFFPPSRSQSCSDTVAPCRSSLPPLFSSLFPGRRAESTSCRAVLCAGSTKLSLFSACGSASVRHSLTSGFPVVLVFPSVSWFSPPPPFCERGGAWFFACLLQILEEGGRTLFFSSPLDDPEHFPLLRGRQATSSGTGCWFPPSSFHPLRDDNGPFFTGFGRIFFFFANVFFVPHARRAPDFSKSASSFPSPS